MVTHKLLGWGRAHYLHFAESLMVLLLVGGGVGIGFYAANHDRAQASTEPTVRYTSNCSRPVGYVDSGSIVPLVQDTVIKVALDF